MEIYAFDVLRGQLSSLDAKLEILINQLETTNKILSQQEDKPIRKIKQKQKEEPLKEEEPNEKEEDELDVNQ